MVYDKTQLERYTNAKRIANIATFSSLSSHSLLHSGRVHLVVESGSWLILNAGSDLCHSHLLYMRLRRFLQDSDTDVNFNKLRPFVAHSSLHSRQWKPNMSIINSNPSPEFMKVEERIESEPLPAKMVHPIQALSNNLVLTISTSYVHEVLCVLK